jgi:hypothetical protein
VIRRQKLTGTSQCADAYSKPSYYKGSGAKVHLRKRRWFAAIYGALLVVATLGGIEFVAGLFAPSWPQRVMRSVAVTAGGGTNSWGMNDRERSISKPTAVRLRSVFIGDSFVDLRFNHNTLEEAVEHLANEAGIRGLEAINLGVVATDPRSYYYRTRDVALSISPDAILVFFFSGNDFIEQRFNERILPPLVDESPGSSIVGRVMPRTDWILVNQLRLANFFHRNKFIADEPATLTAITEGPSDRRIPDLVGHMKRYYFPDVSEDRLTEIVSRGGDKFWAAFRPREQDHEALESWIPQLMVASEVYGSFTSDIRTASDAAALDSEPVIKATLSWLVATQKLADDRHIPFRIFVIPPGNVSPDFEEYWKPWPRLFSWYILCDVRHQRLIGELHHAGVPFVDLRPLLFGVNGAYRLSDGHWTEKGILIVAHRVLDELIPLMAP